jgi:type III pantothenate kinase
MELVFDVGSTETTVGLFRDAVLAARWRMASDRRRTPDETGALLRHLPGARGIAASGVRQVSYASVMPAVAAAIAAAAEQWLGFPAIAIDARVPLPIRVEVDEPLSVGADRLVNAVAAHATYAADAVVVDLGTATTFDCVTGDGAFVGGAIAPGVRTAAEHLVERTARLPRVPLSLPERVIGRRTDACLQSGIVFGAIDQVDGMVWRILAEWARPGAVVIATGGLAPLIAPHCRHIQHVAPDLTLHGIRIAREHLESVRDGASDSIPAASDGSSNPPRTP